MTCFPPCSPWCQCVNDVCVPTPVTINAVRFRTADGRYLQAANGGGGLLVAAQVAAPGPAETFLFVSPATWPLTSGAPMSLNVANASWNPAGSCIPVVAAPGQDRFLVRVDHNVKHIPPSGKGGAPIATYEIGGPSARVYVDCPLQRGYAAYRADDPAEWVFDIMKMVGGVAASPGTPINSGDQVSLRINSNYGKTFFFRVVGGGSGAEVHGDGTALGQAGTVFTAEFNEVRSGLGWRPSVSKCQSCAQVRVTVTDSASGNPIPGATVVAQVPNHPYSGTTGSDGRTTVTDSDGRNCVPNGVVQVRVTHNRHQTKTVPVSVPDSGSIDVTVQLDCTQIRGKVIDTNGAPVAGVTVWLYDNGMLLKDENGNPYKAVTQPDGSFVFNCVPQGFIAVFTTQAPTQKKTNIVPPEGWVNVVIVVQTSCGNLVGVVKDADTGQPIAGATVTLDATSRQETTDSQGKFKFTCVKPAGPVDVFGEAVGYSQEVETATVPTSGDSSPVEIKLHPVTVTAMAYTIRLDWGVQPSDLDAHLSGPDGTGGRFHLFYSNRLTPPVSFADLDTDDVTSQGPEIITIRRSPATAAGSFVAGEYRYWVHNYSGKFNPAAVFAGSNAVVAVNAVDAQGNLTQIGRYEVVNATGPEDDLWYVVKLTIDANGNITAQSVQSFQPGTETTAL